MSRKSLSPDAHLLEELHLEGPSSSHRFHMKSCIGDIVPTLNATKLEFKNTVQLLLKNILTLVLANAKIPERLRQTMFGSDQMVTRSTIGLMFHVNPV